ncbi:MAG: hypothetical protein Q7R65_04745 [bacterium]|nr:hypothetical protein [bacterium]
MDKKLQKWILHVIKVHNGAAGFPIIKNKVELNHWGHDKIPENSSVFIQHQLHLLEKEEKISKEQRPAGMYYIMLPEGHRTFDPWFKRFVYFVLYDKTNVYALFALLVSFAALVVSLLKG